MKTFKEHIEESDIFYLGEEVTPKQLSDIRTSINKQFSSLGIRVDLDTRHFKKRVDDKRNVKPISSAELIGVFKRASKKWKSKKFTNTILTTVDPVTGNKDKQAVIHDKQTDINIAAVLDTNNKIPEFIIKTILRKKEFGTRSPRLDVQMKTFLEYARDYRKEYDNYHARPEQRERNAARLRARRLMVKSGKVEKFDKMDVHHKDNDPLNNEEDNLEVTTQTWNRTEPRLRKEEVNEFQMSGRQQIVQIQKYLDDMRVSGDGTSKGVNVAKKKSIEKRFNLKDVKLDKNGKLISYKTDRGQLISANECDCFDHELTEAEYQGRKVKLNEPTRAPTGDRKKFYVYVKNDKGNIIKLGFGDPNSEIKRDDPKRRAAFRSRHSCDDDIGPKWKARYWSCYQWRAGAKVDN